MEVVLLQDIEKIGKKYDIKNVTNGFARNFLIPKKMAVLATQTEIDKIEELKELEAQKAEEELKLAQDTANQLDGLEIEISVKVAEKGKLFGAISSKQIAEKLKELGFKVKREQIKLTELIKEIGEYDIDIELPHSLEITIKLIVTEETEKKK